MAVPKLDGAIEALREADNADEYWTEHWEGLLERYPDQFVAVVGSSVVASGRELDEVLEAVAEEGLRLEDVRMRFVATNPQYILL